MALDHPRWIRWLLSVASRRATDAELGDLIEEYVAAKRSAYWLVSEVVSLVLRRRSPLTVPERGAEMLSNVRNDIRYALRTLVRNPGFAVAAIVPIALGIGVNTGVFSILNSVAWRQLPVPGAAELVSVHQDFRGGPRRMVHGARASFSIPEYRAYRDEAHTLSGVMGYTRERTVTMGHESPQEIMGILVTCNYFEVLDVRPALGMGFTPANCGAADAPPAVVLSHALWKSGFASDPQILQKPIVLNGRETAVVGIAPEGFDGVDMARASFFLPTTFEQSFDENANVSWLTLIGRRRSDASLAQTRAELSLITKRLDQGQPGRTTTLIVEPAVALSLPSPRQFLLRTAGIIMAAFGLVLLIAAANVANILLARAAVRTREMAIRLSVGATRGRLVQQLLTESAVIAIAGAACGALLFLSLFQALLPWLLTSIPDANGMRLDAVPDRNVLWFGLGLTAVTALVFGLVPALQASTGNVHALARQDAGSTSGRGWIRGTLIGVQIAVCTMLLIPAGLLTRALYAAHTLDPGFDHDNVAVVEIELRGPQFEKDKATIFHSQWLERFKALPGVDSVASAAHMPLSPGRRQTTFRLADESEGHVVDVNHVSANFFSLLGMRIVRGRVFVEEEIDVALVTESTARRYWAGEDALGRTIAMDGRRRQIVGIVRDAQVSQAQEAISSYMYLPAERGAQRSISVLARTGTDLDGFASAVRAETSRMDSSLVVKVQPLSANLGLLQTLSRVVAGLAGMLSLLALGLAAIGIYGVVAYVVSRRRREVGVRMALGADASDVQRLILRQTLRPVVIGMSIGVMVAAAAVRLLQSILFGISPYDPISFIGAPVFMLGIALAAAFVPTRGAMQVDPMSVLRSE